MKHQRGKGKIMRFPREVQSENTMRLHPSETNQAETARPPLVRTATGPRTRQGMDRAKYNARSHGLTARNLLPGESKKDYNRLLELWWEDRQPVGALEEYLVRKLVEIVWYRERAGKAMQAEILKAVKFLRADTEWKQQLEVRRIDTVLASENGGLLQHGQNPLVLERFIAYLDALRKSVSKYGFNPTTDFSQLTHIYGEQALKVLFEPLPLCYCTLFDLLRKGKEGVEEEGDVEEGKGTENDKGTQDDVLPSPGWAMKILLKEIDEETKRLTQLQKSVEQQQAERLNLEAQAHLVPPAAERLTRHMTTLDRDFDRRLIQLERAQRRRRGEKDLPPIKVDLLK